MRPLRAGSESRYARREQHYFASADIAPEHPIDQQSGRPTYTGTDTRHPPPAAAADISNREPEPAPAGATTASRRGRVGRAVHTVDLHVRVSNACARGPVPDALGAERVLPRARLGRGEEEAPHRPTSL